MVRKSKRHVHESYTEKVFVSINLKEHFGSTYNSNVMLFIYHKLGLFSDNFFVLEIFM